MNISYNEESLYIYLNYLKKFTSTDKLNKVQNKEQKTKQTCSCKETKDESRKN